MKTSFLTLAFGVALVSSGAFASGFKCESVDASGYSVKLFNHVDPNTGTRTPAAMIVSQEEEGTLLVRKGAAIRKHNRLNTVQYGVDSTKKLGGEQAILQIRFKEGKEVLRAGETAEGQLIVVSEDGDRDVNELSCERYLKND